MNIPKVAIPGQPLVPAYDSEDEGRLNVKYSPGPGTKLQTIQVQGKDTPVISATILGKTKVFEKELVQDESIINKHYIICVIGKGNEYAQLERDISKDENLMDEDLKPVKISKEYEKFLSSKTTSSLLPQENDIVLCRVIRISARQLNVEIIAVENRGLISKDSGLEASEVSQNLAGSTYSSVASTSLSNNASDIGENFKGIIRLQDIRSTERDKLKINENFKPGDIVRLVIISKGDGSNYYLSTALNDLGVVFATLKNGEGDVMYLLDWETMIELSTGDVEPRKCAKTF